MMRAEGLQPGSSSTASPRDPETSALAVKAAPPPSFRWIRRLLVAFFLLAFICIAAEVILVAQIGVEFSGAIHLQQTVGSANQWGHHLAAFDAVRTRLLILLGITIACFGAIIYLFIRKVAVPIQGVAHAASEIARGNLAVSVPSAIRHEVGDLGQFVNDMAANFQEVLLLTGTTVGNATGSLERIEDLLKSEANPEPKAQLQEHVNSVKRDVESLGSVLKSFKFYQTSFNGREVKHAHPDERSHR